MTARGRCIVVLKPRRITSFFKENCQGAIAAGEVKDIHGEAFEDLLLKGRRLFEKLRRRLGHLYGNLVLHLARTLYGLGVSEVFIGHSHGIAQGRRSKFTFNMWSYKKMLGIMTMKLQEYAMKMYAVVEYGASKYCAYHGVENVRRSRGIISCPTGH